MLLAIAPNGWVLVSHLCKGTIDRGATYGTLASIYLITALGYFEARFVTRLIIREPLMKGAFSVFGLLMWLVSAGCCVVSWLGADVQDPIAWNPHLTWAAGIVAVAIVAEGFLAAEYIRWGRSHDRFAYEPPPVGHGFTGGRRTVVLRRYQDLLCFGS